MLYFIESGIFAKIGYTEDYSTLEKRLLLYRTSNPHFRLIDVTTGTREDEKRLQSLYKDYGDGTEWCYTKRLVTKIWVEYRAGRENVDYYTEFGLSDEGMKSGGIKLDSSFVNAVKEGLITEDKVDLYEEFRSYYED